jgi:hypothetical protein
MLTIWYHVGSYNPASLLVKPPRSNLFIRIGHRISFNASIFHILFRAQLSVTGNSSLSNTEKRSEAVWEAGSPVTR